MKIRLSAKAEEDLRSIERYWIDYDPVLYQTMLVDLRSALLFLCQSPGAGSPTAKSSIRKWRVGRTPYLVFYRAHAKILFVQRIRHERENWRRPH